MEDSLPLNAFLCSGGGNSSGLSQIRQSESIRWKVRGRVGAGIILRAFSIECVYIYECCFAHQSVRERIPFPVFCAKSELVPVSNQR